jgi:hypothetical protein
LNGAKEDLLTGGVLDNMEIVEGSAGAPGAVSISDEIFDRIKQCNVFVADLTVVANYESYVDGNQTRQKAASNSNVLLESGVASCTGANWRRMILVANTAFGPVETILFDIRHRDCKALYDLPVSGIERTAVGKALRETLVKEIAAIYRESIRYQTVKGLEEILKVIPTDAIPIDSVWRGPKIAEVNVRLAQQIIGRRAECEMEIAAVTRPPSGRFEDMTRVHARTPHDKTRHFDVLLYGYFPLSELQNLLEKSGKRVTVEGVLSRADINKTEDQHRKTQMNIDIHQCRLL